MTTAQTHTEPIGSKPRRTCAGCRQPDAREALLRFAVRPEAPYVAPDPMHKLAGRGVSVHPTRRCVRAALERGGFARAARAKVPLSVDEVVRLAAEQYRRRAEGLLSSAYRAGLAVYGTDMVREAMEKGRVRLLVVAADAANRRDELEARAARLGGACAVLGTRASLGRLLGRDEVAVVAITDPKMAETIGRAAHRAKNLTEDE